MSLSFNERLNRILPRITSEKFLKNEGQGNEIGYWIFDYPPECELEVRDFIAGTVLPRLAGHKPPLRFQVVNLFELIVELLRERKLLDKALQMQAAKGNDAVAAALRPVLKEDKLAQRLAQQVDAAQLDLLLLTGVGAAYPLLRAHTLLAALLPLTGRTPVLMFYPGRYNGFSLSLFNKLADDNYYRAFRLVE